MAKVKVKTKAKAKTKPKGKAQRSATARRSKPTRAAAKPKRKIAATRRPARSAARSKAKPAAAARKPQKFIVSHHRDEDFDAGLRSYAHYRDLGLSAATSGMVQAHVIRMIPPCNPAEVSQRHYHDVDCQMIYVLKGWIKNEFEGEGEHVMRAGTCWIQPPRIKHMVLDYSDDCELLEIILPAEFETVTL